MKPTALSIVLGAFSFGGLKMATDTMASNGQKDEHTLEQVEAKEQELRNAFGKLNA